MSYILAIDGGGSKTEFAIAEIDGSILQSIVVQRGSNPWKRGGIDNTVSVIQEGLSKLSNLDKVIICVAGISGCHGSKRFVTTISESIEKYIKLNTPIFVIGDVLTSFRASSKTNHGMIAINGSGSSVSLIAADPALSYTFDAAGYGGIEIGIGIAMTAEAGIYSQNVGNWIHKILEDNKSERTKGLSILYNHPRINDIGVAVSQLDMHSPIFKEIQPFLYCVAVRWSLKIWGPSLRYRTSTETYPDEIIEVVLNGGGWKNDYIRETVIKLLAETGEKLIVLYEPDNRPIFGAIKIAQTNLNT